MGNILRVLGCMLFQGKLRAPTAVLSGQTIALTGPSPGGIGAEAAIALSSFGARMLLGARNTTTAAEVASKMPHSTLLPLDLSDPSSVNSFAASVASTLNGARLDVLVCNAGAHFTSVRHGRAGIEETFRVCALGHLSLIRRLRPRRVVWVTGDIYVLARGEPEPHLPHSGADGYNRACLARMLLTREMKARMGDETAFVAVHPGVVATGLMREAPKIARMISGRVLLSAEEGAQATVLAASCPEKELKQQWALPYFHNKRGWVELPVDDVAMDSGAAERLYAKCEKILRAEGE